MALTKAEHENLLKEIAMTGGDTDNMLKLMQRLRDDFDEREGMLRKYGEERDKETPITEGEREKIREESREDNQEDGGLRRDPIPADQVSDTTPEEKRSEGLSDGGGEVRSDSDGDGNIRREIRKSEKAMDTPDRERFDALRKDYIDRFFGSGAQAIEDNDSDVKKDDRVKDISFEDLFKDREGMM